MANINVTIDRDQCISCESCWGLCPEVFEQNSVDSWSQIVAKYQVGGDPATGSIPDTLRDKTQEAADACPVTIIHVGEK
jgi:ferredoxin